MIQNDFVNKIKRYLACRLEKNIVCALIHGSIGSNEVICYSDFDALVIINNRTLKNPSLLKKTLKELKYSEKIMYQFDPLQHHGWFILDESDLGKYPEQILPVAVLRDARSLFPDNGITLDINPIFLKDKVKANFYTTANAIKSKLKKNKMRNLYHLKGVLSQFMLMPVLYVQVRDGKGVNKKQSFDLARHDFTENEWAIMNEVSDIRLNWHYSINAFQRWLLTRPGRIRTYCARYMPIAIPKDIKSRLTPDFFRHMESLISAMEKKVL